MNLKKKIKTLLLSAAAVAGLAPFTSCSDMREDLPVCELDYRLKFRYDMNLLFANAFHTQVGSVTVYAYDKQGKLAWTKSEKGKALANEDYTMDLNDVPPGEYDLVAWCGLDNDGQRPESFIVPQQTAGSSMRHEINCRMERKYEPGGDAYSDTDLYPLFHGTTHVKIEDRSAITENRNVVYTLPVMKDTNTVRVILQQLSGEDMSVEGFTFRIEDNNGHMNHDNSLRDDEMITYKEWNAETGEAGIVLGDGARSEDTKIKVAIADLTVARLMTDHPMYLTIRNPKGEIAARIPLVDYALLVKEQYPRKMTDQEYLDRQDHYTLTFFLDKSQKWLGTSIIINSWRVVLNRPEV